ncbi:MarR family winged helix-turn-helix transcriptional regulator [Geodermatophilus sp. TF02-6]|uniref:MarR family winged helix-turn-helix transcriptional regulator n=1 Tax=Geodermatophilus sp. TF02-6 TaxID=2250575 RepID=UPI001F2058F5|nr:MarR family transcriptional regulator [Geodermatophilus sp. TF02-6]
MAGLADGHRAAARILDAQLQRDTGIPHAAYVVLAMLSEAPRRSRRMSDLTRRANQSQSRLSHTVARLEERGWVRRERSAEDDRGHVAVLTDAGWDVVRAVAPGTSPPSARRCSTR